MDDNRFAKQAFFEYLLRQGLSQEHLRVYDDYFEFFLTRLGEQKILDLDPETIYHLSLGHVEELDGDEVIEAYLKLMEYFVAYWAERWQALHPDEEEFAAPVPKAPGDESSEKE